MNLAKLWLHCWTTALPVVAADAAVMPSAPPSASASVMRMIGALCIVLSLLFTGVWAYRQSGRFGAGRGRAPKLKVLESRALGHRHAVFVVAYENQRLLLSTSPNGVTMLTHLPETPIEEIEAAAPAAEEPPPNFAAAFLQALAGARK